MPRALPDIPLQPGAVFSTAWLRRWGQNPSRLAHELEARGLVRRLGHGLYHAPRMSRFGEVPPADEALLTAFFGGAPFVITGPPRWNPLGLGSTALFAHPLVYNTRRSGVVVLGGRTFLSRRVAFPTDPPPEWFVIDLLRHADTVGMNRRDLARALTLRVQSGRFSPELLSEMARRFGGPAEVTIVREATAPRGA